MSDTTSYTTILIPPLYIFDLDSTLSLCDHRLHLIQESPKRWREFFALCDKDAPNLPVIYVMHALMDYGADVYIFSGRSDEVRNQSEQWLLTHTMFVPTPQNFRMRRAGDYTQDHELKQQWLLEMSLHDRSRLVGVFDDRDRLVEMWRANGVTCFQVAFGGF